MAYDKSWAALLDPGQATDYFEVPNARPAFVADSRQWQPNNAWWCSEISRVMYRRTDRLAFLRAVGLREHRDFDEGSTQAALLAAETHAVLVFRGTSDLRDWWTNVRVAPSSWPQGGQVHYGFARALLQVWQAVHEAIRQLGLPTFVTGHSLGGALAMLACSQHAFVAGYSFGAPRVGDEAFLQTLKCPLHRIVNDRDVVPTLPPRRMGYRHGGTLHHIAANGSLLRDPTPDDLAESEVALRTASWRAASWRTTSWRTTSWRTPPEPLSDHAPGNYSALLLAAISSAP